MPKFLVIYVNENIMKGDIIIENELKKTFESFEAEVRATLWLNIQHVLLNS
jgi:hypothetical protein